MTLEDVPALYVAGWVFLWGDPSFLRCIHAIRQEIAMNQVITTQSVVAYAQCPRKAFFLLRGDPKAFPHEYDRALEDRTRVQRSKYVVELADDDQTCPRTDDGIDRVVSADDLLATCDALVKARPRAGRIHSLCEPHLVVGIHGVSVEQKLALAYAGYVAGQTRRYLPATGSIIAFGGQSQRVALRSFYPKIRSAIDTLRAFVSAPSLPPPPLVLNKHCSVCPFRNHCLQEAETSDNLTLLERMTPKLMQRYAKKGIFTVSQLSYLFKPRRRRKRAKPAPPSFSLELQALAIRTNKIYLHENPSLGKKPIELYLDIEGIPDQDFYYLIGLLIQTGDATSMRSFWADSPEDEFGIFQACMHAAAEFPDAPIYHYGSYERRAFEKAARAYGIKCDSFLDRLINLNSFIFGKIYFPARSNRLKDLGALVGASWNTPDPSGLQSLAWRYRWEETHGDDYKTMLLTYNRQDCYAAALLVAEIQALSKDAKARTDVHFTNDNRQSCTPTGNTIHTLFEGILKSAHLQYREKRIAFSTAKEPERNAAGNDQQHRRRATRFHWHKRSHKPGKTISVARKRLCPRHHAQRLRPTNEVASQSVIDLTFTRNGVRKTIIKYEGKKAFCPRCRASYWPPAVTQVRGHVFGRSFQAWAVYQRVALRLPYTAISHVMDGLFSEHVSTASLTYFLRRFAEEYEVSEKRLLQRILESPFVHVDETELNVRGRNQYVWVLTDGTRTIFRLTETRETTLIQTRLVNYSGVLISDFYGGYDAIKCRQQKCLVHLIRDLNDDLWKNPFNQEYEAFLSPVRDLLVPIFNDITKFGLKTRHLRKHLKWVDRFYNQVIVGDASDCDLVQTYKKRFVRYRESLFVFLAEDGIPWNNNMAERALRHLAIQRKISGFFYATGATDYLRLLGIAQTCRFQEKSFLQFLLSGERDVDRFRGRKQRR